ncbi:thioesterase family protein [Acidovorax cavernicola]|uniref:Thioesterase family protein n=1 Tax=Acidovorax cavernicola TaxID=1675792 RepID=A0A9X8D4R5_9BURK|nr:thioesterase family protein [Acidovorax cavernicola]
MAKEQSVTVSSEPVFVSDGERFMPTVAAVGPWSADALQGSATAALLVRALEAHAASRDREVARLSFDFWRPAQRSAITLDFTMVRDGAKARTVAIEMVQDGKPVLRCTALLLRRGPMPALPAAQTMEAPRFPPPEAGTPVPAAASRMSPFFAGVDVRMARGQILEPGPAAAWLRLGRPLVDAELASPLAQVASAADLVAGISQWAHPSKLGFVNADLTINLRRAPRGDWMLLDAVTLPGDLGIGYAVGQLHDRDGAIGQCASSLLFEARG